jgi:hypothetical protein
MSRTFLYVIVWVTLASAAVIARFTLLAGTTSETRFPLALTVMLLTFAILAGANIYESRRLAFAAGLRGRGTLGYLRGWVKTANVDLAVDGSQRVPPEAERQFVVFRRVSGYVFASLILIVPILVF